MLCHYNTHVSKLVTFLKHFKTGVVIIVFIQRNKEIYGWERQLRLSRLIILFERKDVTLENLSLAVDG